MMSSAKFGKASQWSSCEIMMILDRQAKIIVIRGRNAQSSSGPAPSTRSYVSVVALPNRVVGGIEFGTNIIAFQRWANRVPILSRFFCAISCQ